METQHLKHLLNRFKVDTDNVIFKPITHGHINDTFLVLKSSKPLYILQNINHNIFRNVELLMQNIEMVLDKLQSKDYISLTLLKTVERPIVSKI